MFKLALNPWGVDSLQPSPFKRVRTKLANGSLPADLTKNIVDIFDDLDASFGSYFSNLLDNFTYSKSDDGHLLLSVEVPGFKEENLKIDIDGNVVNVSGDKKTATSSRSINKSLSIPSGYDTDNVKAELEDGILTLSFKPQKAPIKEVKKIEINKK